MNDDSRRVLSTVLWSVLVGVLGIILAVVLTDDPVGAFLVSALVVFVLYLLPYQLAARWHYWAGTIGIAVALAIYEWR